MKTIRFVIDMEDRHGTWHQNVYACAVSGTPEEAEQKGIAWAHTHNQTNLYHWVVKETTYREEYSDGFSMNATVREALFEIDMKGDE